MYCNYVVVKLFHVSLNSLITNFLQLTLNHFTNMCVHAINKDHNYSEFALYWDMLSNIDLRIITG